MLKRIYERLIRSRWELGFVKGGLDGVFSDGPLMVDWVINPFRDRWFADPFILDVTDNYIYVLAEEFRFKTKKGRIAKLFINRQTLRIERFTILLELPVHLSFPNILREGDRVYVYPESCGNKNLCLYEYDKNNEKLVFNRVIADDAIWDSSITDFLGERCLFTARKDDYHLDVYAWNPRTARFVYSYSIESSRKDSRMAGQLFCYKGMIYCPTQDCTANYGGAVVIKRVGQDKDGIHLLPVLRMESPHRTRKTALHTLNEYKGVAVIDVGGYDFPHLGPALHRLVRKRKKRKDENNSN